MSSHAPVKVAVSSPSFCSSSTLMKELQDIAGIQITANLDGIRFDENGLIAFLQKASAQVAIIGTEPVNKKVIRSCPTLKSICKYGVGMDNLDLEAMKEAGIHLGWSGGVNKRSVSELVLAFALGHARNVFYLVDNMQRGNWIKKGGFELSHCCVGIVGFGHIGTDVAKLLQPFGCSILIHDIVDKTLEAQKLGCKQVSYDELLSQADIITFHVPLTEQTHLMFNSEQIEKTKVGSLIINTARGNIVDFPAVCHGVRTQRLGGFGADVFPHEPFDSREYEIKDRFYFTSHIGGNSKEAVLGMGRSAIAHLKNYLKI